MSEVTSGRRRGRGSVTDLVRSLALVLGVVAVVVAVLAPRPAQERLPALADAAAVRAADAAATELGLPVVLVLGGGPRDLAGAEGVDVRFLGEGWQLDYARTEPVAEDVPTWRQGLLSPEDRRVDVEQARSADVADVWLARPAAEGGEDASTVVAAAEPLEVDGVRWERLQRGDGRTSYVREDAGVTTAVTATDDAAYLVDVVELLSGEASG